MRWWHRWRSEVWFNRLAAALRAGVKADADARVAECRARLRHHMDRSGDAS